MNQGNTLAIGSVVVAVALAGIVSGLLHQALASKNQHLFAIGHQGSSVHGAIGIKGANGANGPSGSGANGINANGANGTSANGANGNNTDGANGISTGGPNGINGNAEANSGVFIN